MSSSESAANFPSAPTVESTAMAAEMSALALRPRRAPWRAADVIIDVLSKSGTEFIFGIPGGTIGALNDALMDCKTIRAVTARHEAGALYAAAGYARVSGKIGICMVTSGPGALNAFTGIAAAHCDSIPMIVLAGEVPRGTFGKGALQEGSANHLNLVGMAKSITKLAIEVTDPNAAPGIINRAITTALSGRPGPVFVSIPLDTTTAMIRRPGISVDTYHPTSAAPTLVKRVAATLHEAKRPLIFAGSGTRHDDGPKYLLELAERLQAPVMTTPKAKGVFPEEHPLSIGVFGFGGHPSTTNYLEGGIDVLLAVGSGLSDVATNAWSPALVAADHFIQIDIDALQIGRNYAVTVGLVGPAGSIMRDLAEHLPHRVRPDHTFGVQTFTDPESIIYGDDNKLAPQRVLRELQRKFPPETIYTCDIGQHLLFAIHYLRIAHPQGFMTMTGLAPMGSSIGAAMGARLARPDLPVVAICGDGCFAMALSDLATAASEKINIVIAVLNDRRYGMVELGNLAIYGRTPAYPCAELDIVTLAHGVGANALIIDRIEDFEKLDLDTHMRDGHTPLVLDIRIDSTVPMRNQRFEGLAKLAPHVPQ